jgi:Fe2+ or Zn2+ uptake regulation protein
MERDAHPPADEDNGRSREALLEAIKSNPSGLSRGEILDRIGLKRDKSGEMSVSNALTALTKANQVSRREGKYVVA